MRKKCCARPCLFNMADKETWVGRILFHAVLFMTLLAAQWGAFAGELRYASTKDIRDINPHMYSGEMAAQNMVFESLVENTPDGVRPKLAERWVISPDGRKYTFFLRRGVRYSNGEAFTAGNAKRNIEAVLENRQRHAWLELVNQIDSVEAEDEHTLVVNLKTPYYPALVELGLTRPFRFIADSCFKDGQTKNGVGGYVGTGPWILAEHRRDQYALFTRNDNYWGEPAKLDAVRWRVLPEPQTILLALEKGDAHLVFGADGDMIDMDSFRALEASGKYATLLSHPIASRAILLNTAHSATRERDVRLALSHAVDREGVAAGIMNDLEAPTKTLLSRRTPYCDIDLPAYDYDPRLAARILDDAGWTIPAGKTVREKDGLPLRLVFSYNANNAVEKTIAEFLQGEMKGLGVDLSLLGEEKQAFLDRQKTGEFSLQYSLSWGPPYDPQSYLSSFRTPAHADFQAQSGLTEKADIDAMISTLLVTPNEQERGELYARVLTLLAEECVYIPLSVSRTKAIHARELSGVQFNLSQYEIPFERMYFE